MSGFASRTCSGSRRRSPSAPPASRCSSAASRTSRPPPHVRGRHGPARHVLARGRARADAGVLLAARAGQGLATAAVIPAALSLLTTTFPEGPLRERALGLNGALMAGGFTTGAIVGGVLTDLLSWRWAFFVNVGVAAAVVRGRAGRADRSRPDAAAPGRDRRRARHARVAAVVLGLPAGRKVGLDRPRGAGVARGRRASSLAAFVAVEARVRRTAGAAAVLCVARSGGTWRGCSPSRRRPRWCSC